MAEYIEREAAIKALLGITICYAEAHQYADAVLFNLNKLPAADVRPVVRGRWIRPTRVPDSMLAECSVCGFDTGAYTFTFCPKCGAMMNEEEESNK